MTIDQLIYFIAIVEYKTFSKAAEEVHLSQSSLSKKIIALEKELDTILFSRDKRQIEVTAIGYEIYKEAKKIIDIHSSMLTTINQSKKMNNQIIRIGALPILSHYNFPQMFKEFKENYQINLELIEFDKELDSYHSLKKKQLDFIIVRKEFIQPDDELQSFEITKDQLVLALPKYHELSLSSSLTIKDLKGYPIYTMPNYTSIYQTLLNLCQQAGFTPIIEKTARVETLISLINIEQAICFLPKRALSVFQHPDIIIKSFTPIIHSSIVLAKEKQLPLDKNKKNLITSLINSKYNH